MAEARAFPLEARAVRVVLGGRQSDVSEVRSGLAPGDSVLTGAFPEK